MTTKKGEITVGSLAGEDKGSVIQLGEGWLGMNLAYQCYLYILPWTWLFGGERNGEMLDK